ncbi:MAG: hypothetical protein IIB65_01480 [Proteobacteria bacterium]|nr:hypothetical protein [Pseudomonadota bacterium]
MARGTPIAVVAGLLIFLAGAPAWAQTETATPTQYQFVVQKIELCTNSTCTSPTVLGQGSQAFDIGSGQVSAGQAAGTFLTDFSLAANQTFTHIRVTHTRAIDITATAPTFQAGGQACVTGAGGDIVTAATITEVLAEVTTGSAAVSQVFFVPNTDANNAPGGLAATYATEGIVLIDGTTMTITKPLTSPFTSGGTAPTFDVAFDVANTITFNVASGTTCSVFLGPPTVTITIK